ncbi:hypothetical protein [Terrabacter sp. RAF57]|uniref:hypothetical protein n=1 Tax=Terrabacter sp. RAF57 TaxID=3233063 RepID=UPI003F94DAF4
MTTPKMVVLHLSTGHVLAAATASETMPTAAALTGGSFVAVRVDPGDLFVHVTTELLTELPVTVDNDVLSAPTSFRVVKAVPPLANVGPPTELPDPATQVGDPGVEVLSLWQIGHQLEVVRDKLDGNGKLTSLTPQGGTLRLIAIPGKPLHYAT